MGCLVSCLQTIIVRDLRRHLLFPARKPRMLRSIAPSSLTFICCSIFEYLLVAIASRTQNTLTIRTQFIMDKILPSAVGFAVCWLLYTELRYLHNTRFPSEESTIVRARSALETRHLEHKCKPPYRKDTFPGSREFETVYGTIQIFEWGPKDGEKVLLVHGLGTPCIALGDMAKEFVNKGCRVMLFGLSHTCARFWRPLTLYTQICSEEAIQIHPVTLITIPAFTPFKYSLSYLRPHSPGQDLPPSTSWDFLSAALLP